MITQKFSITVAKYHIYVQNLKGNDNIDMYAYLAYLKQQHCIEKQIFIWTKEKNANLINIFLSMICYNLDNRKRGEQLFI